MNTLPTLPAVPEAATELHNEYPILLAVSVTAPDRETAEKWLHHKAPTPYGDYAPDGTHVDSWWIAEDDRRDGSDCSSAVFIPGDHPASLTQQAAYRILEAHSARPTDYHDELDHARAEVARLHGILREVIEVEIARGDDDHMLRAALGDYRTPEADAPEDRCLIVYPTNYALHYVCPRCKAEAGEHPAPCSLLPKHLRDHPVRYRPSYREARVKHDDLAELRAAVHLIADRWESGDLAEAVRDAVALLPEGD